MLSCQGLYQASGHDCLRMLSVYLHIKLPGMPLSYSLASTVWDQSNSPYTCMEGMQVSAKGVRRLLPKVIVPILGMPVQGSRTFSGPCSRDAKHILRVIWHVSRAICCATVTLWPNADPRTLCQQACQRRFAGLCGVGCV